MQRALLIFIACLFLLGPVGVTGVLLASGHRPTKRGLRLDELTVPHPAVLSVVLPAHKGPACAELIAQLEHRSAQRRELAADALAAGGTWCDEERAVPALVRRLQDPDVNVRWAVNRTLGAYGFRAAAAVPALIAALANPETKEWASSVLASVGREAVPALIAALDDRRLHVRRAAAYALGEIGRPALSATAKLLRLGRHDPSWAVKRTARWAAASIHGKLPAKPGPPIVGDLVKAMGDPACEHWVPTALSVAGKPAVPALIRALGDHRARVRRLAAFTLGTMDEKAAPALSALKRRARVDADPQVRRLAKQASRSVGW
jgi:HEAT repeat protein